MKKIITTLLLVTFISWARGQEMGNVNYANRISYAQKNIDIQFSGNNSVVVKVKGLANIKADSYVAIFSVTQVGKTTEEVNNLLDLRINNALEKIKQKNDINSFVDMISFVPVYDYEVAKKIFSKKTYSEIPVGFELKKNIHIEYKDNLFLQEIISSLAQEGIYDLVRVDYFSTKIEAIKSDIRQKAKEILRAKITNYEDILQIDLDSLDKNIVDGFQMVLPWKNTNLIRLMPIFQ